MANFKNFFANKTGEVFLPTKFIRLLQDRLFLILIAASTKVVWWLGRLSSTFKAVHISSGWELNKLIAFFLLVPILKLQHFFLHFSNAALLRRNRFLKSQILFNSRRIGRLDSGIVRLQRGDGSCLAFDEGNIAQPAIGGGDGINRIEDTDKSADHGDLCPYGGNVNDKRSKAAASQ